MARTPKTFTWHLKVTVDASWVADGFALTPDRCEALAECILPYAYDGEVKVTAVKGPSKASLRKAQGY